MRLFSAADNRWPRARPPRRPNALAISDAFMRTFYLALSIQTRRAPHPSVFCAVVSQGGDLSADYIASFENNQDFWDPEFDRGPASNDVRHRLNGSFIYELPGTAAGTGSSTASLVVGSFPASYRRDRARHCESSSHRASTAAGPTSYPASIWCSPIGATGAMHEAAAT